MNFAQAITTGAAPVLEDSEVGQPTTFVVEAPSARGFRNCLLGEGRTKADALEDAFGPKPWTSFTKRSARNAWVRQVTEDELHELREASANA